MYKSEWVNPHEIKVTKLEPLADAEMEQQRLKRLKEIMQEEREKVEAEFP